jgi:hypothetical protein
MTHLSARACAANYFRKRVEQAKVPLGTSTVRWDPYVTEDHKRGHIIRMEEGNCIRFMSELGQKAILAGDRTTSALPPRTDMADATQRAARRRAAARPEQMQLPNRVALQ